jgi:hypothetical protein
MLTPITCLTLVCDGCNTTAEDDQGAPCHFTTVNEAVEWLGLDPHATVDDDLARWHFGTDGTHLCPDCQCAAHGHVTTAPVAIGGQLDADGALQAPYLAAICLRCGHWLDLGPIGTGADSAAVCAGGRVA